MNMNIVEISIDLNNPNQKPIVDVFKVTKEIKDGYMAKNDNEDSGRRFSISGIDHVLYRKPMMYNYRYRTEEEDYQKIYESEKTMSVMSELQDKLQVEINFHQTQLNGVMAYYKSSIH